MSADPRTEKGPTAWIAKVFREVDWLIPPYLRTGFLTKLAKEIELAAQPERLELIRVALAQAYGPEYLAIMFLERYSKILHVRDFRRQIDESIKSYFSGYTTVAVVTLVTVIEGIVRRIATAHSRDVGQGTRKLNLEFEAFVAEEMKSPHCFGERVVMLEVLRDFVRDRLLKNTSDYDGLNEFNRHGILHGIFENFGDDLNFFRLITLLDLLCFSIGLTERVSSFAAEPTAESHALASHYLLLRAQAIALSPPSSSA